MTTARQQQLPGSFKVSGATLNGHDANIERSSVFSWDDWFRHASPQQRMDALGLAQQQGLLYPHQLPISSNGVKPTSPVKESELSALLAKVLSGKPASLPAIACQPVAFFDSDLDDLQKHAVSLALNTPDVLLMQGLPGTGKSRVVTEIILQHAARGQRVLFLGGHAASLDVVLERLVGRAEVFALRLLDATEKVDSFPPWLRGFTLDEQKQAFLERVLAGARQNREQFEMQCRNRRDQATLWDELQGLIDKSHVLQMELHNLLSRSSDIADQVNREPSDAIAQRLRELQVLLDRDLQEWEGAIKQKRDALDLRLPENSARAKRIAELEPGYQAKTRGSFFSFAYWANCFNSSIVSEMERLQQDHGSAAQMLAALQKEIEELEQRCQDRRTQFDQERMAIIRGEVEFRLEALGREIRAIEDQQHKLDEQWNGLCIRLNQGELAKTSEAISAARQTWLTHKQYDEQQCQFARQWTEFVESTGPQLATRLPSLANVVAGTVQRWNADSKFRDTVSAPFDLLIVEDADSLTDAELLKLSRFATRCTLVTQKRDESLPATTNADKAFRAIADAPSNGSTSWSRLWQALGGDAWRGPYSWRRDQGRHVCQLLPLVQSDYLHLESEGLADAPDIELRILHTPRATPRLAQVIFGTQTSFGDAFAFVMREIQEFPLETRASTGWWSEPSDCLRLNFGNQPAAIETWITLEPGVRIGAWQASNGETPRIACIAFDRCAGWDRVKAYAWVQKHHPHYDSGRTVLLQTPYRFTPQLAKFIQTILQPHEWQMVEPNPHDSNSVEFIAVPALAHHEWPRAGAGLELDLAASRNAERLPVGLRQGLPVCGYVNYVEAQALVRRLEAWSEQEIQGARRRVAVLALYQGQVELLRRLVEQSEALRSRSFPLEITLPSRMNQRECEIAFLSMTRSHVHRATAYGESADELPIALTRACEYLFVFGDPGTLNRRTQWNGPLDQLDSNSAQQELSRIQRLVACLQHPTRPIHANGKP